MSMQDRGKFVTQQYMIITERLNNLSKVIQLISGEARISTPNHLIWKASILNHQVTCFCGHNTKRQHGRMKMPAGPPFSCMHRVDGWARAGIVFHGVHPGCFYPMALLCVVSMSNIISRSKKAAPTVAITSVFQSLGRRKEENSMHHVF